MLYSNYVVGSQEDLNKILIGWNIGLCNYSNYTFSFFQRFRNFNSFRIKEKFDQLIEKKFNYIFRGELNYSNRKISSQRDRLFEILNSIDDKNSVVGGKVNKKIYLSELLQSRLSLSPFGWGEICYRDFESMLYQSLLLKPNIDHLVTFPDFFINHFTYVPLSWDLSDTEGVIFSCLNDYDNHQFLISKFLNDKGLKVFDNKLVHKLILYYHFLKQRKELGYIINNTDAFVMLSERFRQELYQLVPGVKKYNNKIYGINNPFEVLDLDISAIKKKNVILYVGRLEISQKRVDLLLEIWSKLHGVAKDWEFWVVGHGTEEDNMKNYCLK